MTSHSIPGLTVFYGTVLDLTIEDRDTRIRIDEWNGWLMLVAENAMRVAPGRAKIFLVRATLPKGELLEGDEHDAAQETYERWMQRDAKSVAHVDVPDEVRWAQGRVLRLGYRSDKWSRRGKQHDYDHDFTERGRPPLIYTNTQRLERARAAVIVGGDMAITEGGID